MKTSRLSRKKTPKDTYASFPKGKKQTCQNAFPPPLVSTDTRKPRAHGRKKERRRGECLARWLALSGCLSECVERARLDQRERGTSSTGFERGFISSGASRRVGLRRAFVRTRSVSSTYLCRPLSVRAYEVSLRVCATGVARGSLTDAGRTRDANSLRCFSSQRRRCTC